MISPIILLCAAAMPQTGSLSVPPELKLTRPDAGSGPTDVYLGFYLVDVFSIEDADESFTADLVFVLRWRDPRLAELNIGPDGARVPLDSVWNPRLAIVNREGATDYFDEVVHLDPDGSVFYQQRLVGKFSCELDLRDFPMDEQDLTIHFLTLGSGPDEVRLLPDPDWTGSRENVSPANWNITLGEPEVTTEYLSIQDRHLSRLDQHLLAQRRISYYYSKVFLPLALILFMSWLVFWIDPHDSGPQFGISTASVFTLIAFELGLSNSLPKIAYLTRADQFILGATVMVFLALGEAVVTARLVRTDRVELGRRIDRWARLIYPLMFVALAAFTVWNA